MVHRRKWLGLVCVCVSICHTWTIWILCHCFIKMKNQPNKWIPPIRNTCSLNVDRDEAGSRRQIEANLFALMFIRHTLSSRVCIFLYKYIYSCISMYSFFVCMCVNIEQWKSRTKTNFPVKWVNDQLTFLFVVC